jgi:hypothetical protein
MVAHIYYSIVKSVKQNISGVEEQRFTGKTVKLPAGCHDPCPDYTLARGCGRNLREE